MVGRAAGREGRAEVVIGACVLLIGAVLFARSVGSLARGVVIDDAFITFRYARHWAMGAGPTWNPGASPVEGYSSPLLTAILALAARLGADLPTAGRVVSVGAGLVAAATGLALTHRLTGRVGPALLAAGLSLAHPHFAVAAANGMESTLYAATLALSALALHRALARPTAFACAGLAVALGLAVLVRTEGAIAVAAAAPVLLLPATVGRRRLFLACAAAAAVFVLHLVVRRTYYGLWVPTPALEKGEAWAGSAVVLEFVGRHALVLAAAAAALVRLPRGPSRGVIVFALLALALEILVVLQVDPVMASNDRYLVPFHPLAVACAVWAIRRPMRWPCGPTLALAALLAHAGWLALDFGPPAIAAVERYGHALHRSHVGLARWLERRLEPYEATVAVSDCGVIPYYSEQHVIDLFGLNDPHIAVHGVDADYVFGRRPDFVVVSTLPRDAAIRDDPRLRAEYERVQSFPGLYELQLYQRRDVVLLE